MDVNMTEGNSISDHLLKQSLVFRNSKSRPEKVLQSNFMSNYLINCGESVLESNIFNKSNSLKVCRRCLITWTPGMFSAWIKPEKHRGKSIRYLIRKNYEDLNKYQRKLVKKCIRNENNNFLTVLCHVCRKKSEIPIKKPTRITDRSDNEERESIVPVKKKKKRKKDSFAGLNQEVCTAIVSSSSSKSRKQQINQSIESSSILSNTKGTSNIKEDGQKNIVLPQKINQQNTFRRQLKVKRIIEKIKLEPTKQNKKSLLASFLDSL